MCFFSRYGVFNMTVLHCKCVLHINYFRIIIQNYFYPNKSSDHLQTYSMLDKDIKIQTKLMFKFTTNNKKKIDLSVLKESFFLDQNVNQGIKKMTIKLSLNLKLRTIYKCFLCPYKRKSSMLDTKFPKNYNLNSNCTLKH